MLNPLDVKYFKMAVGSSRISKETPDDIAVKCPICGDSHTGKKARLHLYKKGDVTLVNCFNGDCPCKNKPVRKFLRQFFPDIEFAYNRESFSEKNLLKSVSDELDFTKHIETSFLTHKVKTNEAQFKFTNGLKSALKPIEGSPAEQYLKSRGFEISDSKNLGQWFWCPTDLKIGDQLFKTSKSIVIPLYWQNNIYGFYSRHLTEKIFYSYINPSAQGFKVWNWFNIDKTKPVYIFEGIFDALSAIKSGLTNSVACMQATLPEDRISELAEPVFCLDNDRIGLKNILKLCRNYKVCVFDNPYKDCNEMLLAGLDVKSEIDNHIETGIKAEIKIRQKS